MVRKNGRRPLNNTRKLSRTSLSLRKRASARKRKRMLLGRYIVADSAICHGKPTFRGTRIFVSDVLEMVADGVAWETIIEQWHNSISREAITEAVKLSSEAFFRHTDEFALKPVVRFA